MKNIQSLKSQINRFLKKFGYEIRHYQYSYPSDFEDYIIKIINKVNSYTMTSAERISALCKAVEYISKNNIAGAIVECGVWRGGSMMAVIETLIYLNDYNRKLYLFDTFAGMTEPTQKDRDFQGNLAQNLLEKTLKNENNLLWCHTSLETVKQNINQLKYDGNKIHFIEGKVEETLPQNAPEEIALLRLDTDWYESTRHELIHLFPRLVSGGVIIIDDYGYWQGARQAVDEYIEQNKISLLLNRIDNTGRIGVILK